MEISAAPWAHVAWEERYFTFTVAVAVVVFVIIIKQN